MSFVKICFCGKRIDFEQRMSFPDNCPVCGRNLVGFQTYDADDPQLEELLKRGPATAAPVSAETPTVSPVETGKTRFSIRLSNGKEIEIPEEGCIIGRTETGAEELAEFPSVSRQHIKVIIRRNIGVLIEDVSRFGTLIDGQRIPKNTPQVVPAGAKITLCNVDSVLVDREDNDL